MRKTSVQNNFENGFGPGIWSFWWGVDLSKFATKNLENIKFGEITEIWDEYENWRLSLNLFRKIIALDGRFVVKLKIL